jgi:hypothetical protein
LILLQSVKNISLVPGPVQGPEPRRGEIKNELNNRVKIIINKLHYNNIE